MNMIGRVCMVPSPAPQSKGLQRLRIASGFLLLLSAVCVALIHVIHAISFYLVAVVPVIMLAAVVSAALYWWHRSRLEKAWRTDARTAERLAQAIGGTDITLSPEPRRSR